MRYFVILLLTFALSACQWGGGADKYLAEAVVLLETNGAYAVASATRDDVDVEDAIISVDNTILSYGLPVSFETDSGLLVDLMLPIYYADLSGVASGDKLNFRAKDSLAKEVYGKDNVEVPEQIQLGRPTEGEIFGVTEDVGMSWDEVRGAKGYLGAYVELNAFNDNPAEEGEDDVEYEEDDAGIFMEYKDAGDYNPIGMVEMLIPNAYTVAGDALFSAYALNGDTDIFTNAEKAEQSFFLVATAYEVQGEIEGSPAEIQAVAGSEGLTIAKEYAQKEQGLRFTVRETDPQQITGPGTVTVGFKMRKFKVSVAFVKAFDINGNEYFSWVKKRIFKSKKKKYFPSFSASPGTTLVIGTHDASYRGGSYSY